MKSKKFPKGFTLVELIMTISLLGIMAAVSGSMIVSLMQMSVYAPRQTKAREVAQEALDVMIEGDSRVRGMRFSNKVVEATDGAFTYEYGYPTYSEKRKVRLSWDGSKLYRQYSDYGDMVTGLGDFGPNEVIPYIATGDIQIKQRVVSGSARPIFKYYKQNGGAWTAGTSLLKDIRSVTIEMTVTTGSGLFKNWDGTYTITSGVEIKQYEI